MDFNKLTIKSQEAVAAAHELARRRGNPEVYPEHLLLALLDQELFADWQGLRADGEQRLAGRPAATGAANLQPRISNSLEQVLDRAEREQASLEDELARMRRRIDRMEREMRDTIEDVHRQYRRDLVLWRPPQPLDVRVRVQPRVAGGPPRPHEAPLLVEPQRLRVHADQVGGDRDHVPRPVVGHRDRRLRYSIRPTARITPTTM